MASNESTMKIRADISQLKSAMQQASRAIQLANSEFKASTAGMDKWSSSATGLQAKLKQLNSVLSAQKRQLSLAKQELAQVEKAYGKDSAEADRARIRVNKYQAAVNKSTAEMNKYEKELNDVENGLKDTGSAAQNAGSKVKSASDGFTVMKGAIASLIASGIRRLGRELGELGKATFMAGANFEQSMSKVAAVSGASGSEMKQLSDKAKEMGETTKFSASESAEAFNYMAMAGWKNKDMLNGISGVMSLAAASGEDLATTSDIVTDALTAMGYEAGDATHFADVMAAASSNANTNVGMMGETFKYAAPLVGSLGYSMEDTSVAIGLMANSGIKASQAGTSLRSILSRLASPPKEAAAQLNKLGIELKDSQGKMKPLNQVVGEMRTKFKGLSETEKAQAASAIAGKNAMSGFLAIVNSSDKDFNKLTKAVNNADGAAKDMADTMNDNVAGQITLLKSKVEGIMIKVFEKAAPKIRTALDSISKALDNVNWDSVADQVASGINTVVNMIKFLIANGSTVISVIKLLGVTIATAFTVNKVATFANSIQSLVGVFGKAKGAATTMGSGITSVFTKIKGSETLASGATKLFGGAMKMLPWGAAIAGAGALAYGLIQYQKHARQAMLAEYQLTAAQKKSIQQSKQSKVEYDNFNKTRQDNIRTSTAEYDHLGQLKNEYNSMVGANGKVKKGYEDRANFIKSELASAMGVEVSEIDKLIGKNGKLSSSIDKVIAKKKAEAALQADEGNYQEAIKKQGDALKTYSKAQDTAAQATEKYNQIHAKAKSVTDEYQKLLAKNPEAAERYLRSNQSIMQQDAAAAASKNKANAALKKAEAAYIGYTQTIQNHEGLAAAVISGDGAKIQAALTKLQNNFVTAKNGTKATLTQQVKDYENNYRNLQNAVKKGMPGVTQAQVKEAKKMVDASKKELAKFKGEAGKAGKAGGKNFAKGTGSAAKSAKSQGNKVGKSAKAGLTSGSKGTKKTGQKRGSEFASGVGSKKRSASSEGTKVGKGAKSGISSGSKGTKKSGTNMIADFINGITGKKGESDSKSRKLGSDAKTKLDEGKGDTTSSGTNFVQGFINGMESLFGSALDKAFNLGAGSAKKLDSGLTNGSPSKAAHQSGEWFVQGFINGIDSLKAQSDSAAFGVGADAVGGLNDAQQSHSPSKLTEKSGKDFVAGYIKGITSQQGQLVTVVKNAVSSALNALRGMANFNFSDVAAKAIAGFGQAMQKKIDYMTARMQYENEVKIADFEKTISGLEKKRDQKTAARETQRDKKVAKIEKKRNNKVTKIENKRDKKVRALEKKRDKKGTSKSQKKKINRQIKSVKNTAKKQIKGVKQSASTQIKSEKNAAKKQIKATQKNYNKLIATQEKYKDAYQTASSQMMSDFSNALSEYQSAAQDLIDSTINGITDKYNQRYDELMAKQDGLIEKLKGSVELFNISGANVITVNNIKEQTKAITDYTSKLEKIKKKVSEELFDEILGYDMAEGSAFMDQLLGMSAADLKAYDKSFTDLQKLIQSKSESLFKSDFDKIAKEYKNEINAAFATLPAELEKMGNQAMQGFINGLGVNTDYMSKEIKTWVNGMISTFKSELGIKSPSKVMAEIGEYTGEGFNKGLMGMLKKIQGTASEIAEGVATPINAAVGDINGIKSNVNAMGSAYNPTQMSTVNNYNLVQNNTSPKSLSALETYQARRRQIAMVKAVTA